MHQTGVALLMIVMVMLIFSSSLVLSGMQFQSYSIERNIRVTGELAEAKETLLAFAAAYPDNYGGGPGRLPCPDYDNSGVHDDGFDYIYCSIYTTISRLPEYADLPTGGTPRFKLNDTYADFDQQFWYNVTDPYRCCVHPYYEDVLNSETAGAYSVDGTTDIVAVLIAPGEELDGQNRVAGPFNRFNYMEGNNAVSSTYTNANTTNPAYFNDIVMGISRSEVMTVATFRVVQEIKRVLDAYYLVNANSYPITEALVDTELGLSGAAWLDDDEWIDILDYTFVNTGQATISFDDCAIVHTIVFGGSITRDVPAC